MIQGRGEGGLEQRPRQWIRFESWAGGLRWPWLEPRGKWERGSELSECKWQADGSSAQLAHSPPAGVAPRDPQLRPDSTALFPTWYIGVSTMTFCGDYPSDFDAAFPMRQGRTFPAPSDQTIGRECEPMVAGREGGRWVRGGERQDPFAVMDTPAYLAQDRHPPLTKVHL